MSLWKKYNDLVRIHHGWEVALQCPQCDCEGVPQCEAGEVDNEAVHMNASETPLLFSTVTCRDCGCDLRAQAAVTLKEMFADVPKTLGWPSLVMGLFLAFPFVACATAWAGVLLGWWSDFDHWFYRALAACGLLFMIFYPLGFRRMYACPCGQPRYLLMGALGRSSCFRCSTCSRLLRRGW